MLLGVRCVTAVLVLAACAGPSLAGEGATFKVKSHVIARVAPHDKAPECVKLDAGATLDAGLVAAGWYGFKENTGKGRTCWAPADRLEPVKTRGLPLLLVPLAIEAGSAVVKWVVNLFSGAKEEAKPVKVEPGAMVSIVERAKDRLKVRLGDGTIGWIAAEALSMVQELRQVPRADQAIWQASAPAVAAAALTVEAWVQKADGTVVPSGGTLRLGDEYEIHARCSQNCFIRVTCETPGAGAVCQYSPSQHQGFEVSPAIRAGEDAWPYLLPKGVRFKVSEPVMPEDVIRVEAVSAAAGIPFRYVAGSDKGEGCVASTAQAPAGGADTCGRPGAGAPRTSCGYRGGGFSVTAAGVQNPVPDVVSVYVLRTVR